MNTKEKYEDIKVSMLPEKTRDTLEKIKKATKDFSVQNDKADAYVSAVHSKLKKEKPSALRSEDKKPEPKPEPKKAAPKPKPEPKTKPEPKPKPTKTAVKATTTKVNALTTALQNDPLLKGLGKTDKERDAGRRALPAGRRVSKKGWKNQHGTSKGGRVYYENRENRSDRKSPDYKGGYPYLAMGGYTHREDEDGAFYVNIYTERNGEIIDVKEKTYKDKDSAMAFAMMKGNFLKSGESVFVMDEDGDVLYKKVSMKRKGGYMADGGNIGRDYVEWETEVTQILADKLDIDYGDASGIVEAQPFYLQQSWTKGLSAEETADVIDEKSMMAKGGEVRSYKTFVEEYPDKKIYVRVKFAGSDKDVQNYEANEVNKKRAIAFAKRLAEKNNGTYEGFQKITLAKGGYTARGEDYEYKNTFGINQNDFNDLVDAYHKGLHSDQFDRLDSRVTFSEMRRKYGRDKVDKIGKYIDETHKANSNQDPRKYMAKGGAISKTTYVSNRNIDKVDFKLNNDSKSVKGEDLLDGVYVKNTALKNPKAHTGSNKYYDRLVEYADTFYNGLDADELEAIKKEDVNKLANAGFDFDEICIIYLNASSVYQTNIDNELDSGLIGNTYESIAKTIDQIISDSEKGIYEMGIKYPEFNWDDIVKKYNISKQGIEVKGKEQIFSTSKQQFVYQVFKGDKVALSTVVDRIRYVDGKLDKDDFYKKDTASLQKFEGGYWSIVSSDKNVLKDIAKMILRKKTGYVKNIEVLYNTLGGANAQLIKDASIKFAKGGQVKGFDALSKKVAARYEGKKVPSKYQSEYGKTYDKEEAKEVGDKVAAKVYRLQLAKKGKMAKGGEIKKGDMVIVDNPYWKLEAPFKAVKRKVKAVFGDDVFFTGGSTSNIKYVKKYEDGGELDQGFNDRLDESMGNRDGKEAKMEATLKDRRNESKGENKAVGKRPYSSVHTMDKMAEGGELGKIKLPHNLKKYFTKPAGTIEVEMNKLIPIRAREKGIVNAERYMRLAYDGKMERRKPITIYKSRNGKYRIKDGNSTFAVAKKHNWKTIWAEVVENPNISKRKENSVFTVASKIRKEGESWASAVKRAGAMKK